MSPSGALANATLHCGPYAKEFYSLIHATETVQVAQRKAKAYHDKHCITMEL